MRIAPSRQFHIVSQESVPEVANRLLLVVKPRIGLFDEFRMSRRPSPPNPLFAGYVGTDRFRIQRIITYRNSAHPELVGFLKADGGNTVVEVRAGLDRLGQLVYTTLVPSLAVSLVATVALFLHGDLSVGAPLLVAGFLCTMILATVAGFKGEVERSRQLLTSVLTPHGDSAKSGAP